MRTYGEVVAAISSARRFGSLPGVEVAGRAYGEVVEAISSARRFGSLPGVEVRT